MNDAEEGRRQRKVTLTDFARLPGRVGHIPNPRRTVTRTRNDEPAIAGKVEGVDLLLVAFEHRPNSLLLNVPNL